MAPEYPPGLLIFDARNIREEGGEIRLMGDMTFIETPLGQLRVRWGAGSQPAGFLPVGGGVAYVFKTDDLRIEPAIDYPHPDHHGNLRFRWEEGLKSGIPWIMFILILPEGYTFTEPHPAPARAQIFDGRLALYWMLRGDEFNRTYIVATKFSSH